ncbi:MAG: ABC transporter permease subunit [Methylococcaceae bacterium]|nr:ABC transporter permease subunit [Methylococcaceae bacterium]
MSEIIANKTPNPNSALHTASASYYQRWRLIKDLIARYGILIGGWGVIVAIVLIFFYLLYVVVPLFIPASAKSVAEYQMPAKEKGKTLLLAIEEQNEVAVRFTDQAQAVFFNAHTGDPVHTEALKIPAGLQVSSFSPESNGEGVVAYGLNNGRVLVAKYSYRVTYPKDVRVITPVITYPLGEQPLTLDSEGGALQMLALQVEENNATLVAKTATHKLKLLSIHQEKALFGEATVQSTEATLELVADKVGFMLIDKEQRYLYVVGVDGSLSLYDISDKSAPILKQQLAVLSAGQQVSSMDFVNGGLSLLIADSTGLVAQWSVVRDAQNNPGMQKIRSFKVSDDPLMKVSAEQRRKGFLTVDKQGVVGAYNTTAERELLKLPAAENLPEAFALSPRANAFLLQSANGAINFWQVSNEHPEVSMKSLWGKVWYESYPKPAYIWQSSSSSNDFEPKYSLTPLVFGTLKAAFYAMLFAVPLSLMGAIYAAYFMAPSMRSLVKPTIELMGALPTVILGFLAGLWLAPFLEENLLGVFIMLIMLPIAVLGFGLIGQFLPKTLRLKVPDGMEAMLLIPVIIGVSWLAFAISPMLEALFFQGDLRVWMKTTLDIDYDQRNSLVVGIAMGFAVVPSIFTIAEDAIFSVPKHLTVGSLALGATPWQTLMKVVLLTASPGIFSAIMIGLGRAIGETMIVLMATGNTPVMDFSVFQGMRTLAANVAVEMPESEVDSTHYRVLFLAALVLFLFTFVFNTLAELIRQHLREKYSSL